MLRDAFKTWSFQAGTALAILLGIEQAMPQLAGLVPQGVYAALTVALAIAIPILRSVRQPKLHGQGKK